MCGSLRGQPVCPLMKEHFLEQGKASPSTTAVLEKGRGPDADDFQPHLEKGKDCPCNSSWHCGLGLNGSICWPPLVAFLAHKGFLRTKQDTHVSSKATNSTGEGEPFVAGELPIEVQRWGCTAGRMRCPQTPCPPALQNSPLPGKSRGGDPGNKSPTLLTREGSWSVCLVTTCHHSSIQGHLQPVFWMRI